MRLITLGIKNFRSFRNEQVFKFGGVGFHSLCGDNQKEVRLGANGAGKSTVFDALCWLLYGKTMRGLRGPDVANWDVGKQAEVWLLYEGGGKQYKVVRTWNPNTWRLHFITETHLSNVDLVDDATNLLWHHLKIGYGAALHSIFIAQDRPMFLDLLPAAKAVLFSEVLGLDKWLKYSERAAKTASNFASEAFGLEKDIAALSGELSGIKNIDFTGEVDEFEFDRKRKIAGLETEYMSLVAKTKDLKKDLVATEKSIEALVIEKADHHRSPDVCPSCKQAVVDKRYAGMVDQIRNGGFVKTTQQRNLKLAEDRLEYLEQQVEDLTGVKNPFLGRQTEMEDKKEKLEMSILSCRGRLEDTQYKQNLYTFWVQGFKDLRLSLIASSLCQLEIETNSCLNELGLVGWSLRFTADRENKSGNMTRGFTVKVESPQYKELVAWESWSGGESQRLRLAATLGLSSLIRSATGCTLNLEVLDEPTAHLNVGGIDDLLGCLRDRAHSDKRQIWVVDHRGLGHSDFDSVTMVVKRDDGSYIEH